MYEDYALSELVYAVAVALKCANPGITARALASIADVLGAMAQAKGGLRSGPALNPQWQPAFQHLQVAG